MKLIIYTDGYDCRNYEINPETGFISYDGIRPSGKWVFEGLQHVKRNEFIPLKALTTEKINSIIFRFKNGKGQWRVVDVDHGTLRIWGARVLGAYYQA